MRMQLTWLGEPGPLISTKNTFKVCVVLVVAYAIYSTALDVVNLFGDAPSYLGAFRFLGWLLFSVWSLYALCKTRENLRARYSIEEQNCAGCEDFCCSLFCTCCTAAQLARHTGEYEKYPGACCTETGHPVGTPLVV
eukprot:CAMPEP_0116847184 /NCGR_PEP_ID=MMETSP0418-20121206/14289_1 /TAXON_ID=1158023 /ORGANISM="Astrosyne radiata, Strain 13vi08-1A" /LENGTH=136 /DNA_ID=CAMNT_0004478593 /DNA_START=89 /DNA_END=499 /DNA_ORIENTATION=+